MLKQEDMKIAEETSVSSPCLLTLWGRWKMQTSHNQRSAPASSLNRQVKELGQRSPPQSPAATTALLLPRPTHREPEAGLLNMTKGNRAAQKAASRHSCLSNRIKRNNLSCFPPCTNFFQFIRSQAKSIKVTKSK